VSKTCIALREPVIVRIPRILQRIRASVHCGGPAAVKFLSEKNAWPSEKIADAGAPSH
jgi:hypothetical protein